MERCIAHEHEVKKYLCEYIGEVDACERHFIHEHGADGVEENLKGAEEGFSEKGVEEYCFEGGGEVGV
jgi:hypothetical protein